MTTPKLLVAAWLVMLFVSPAGALPLPPLSHPLAGRDAMPTTFPMPELSHWTCWRSFRDVHGFDECDSQAVLFVGGLPRGTRQIRVECRHELHYVTRRDSGNAASIGIREQATVSRQTVTVRGDAAFVSVSAHLGVRSGAGVPTHYWQGPLRCEILGVLR